MMDYCYLDNQSLASWHRSSKEKLHELLSATMPKVIISLFFFMLILGNVETFARDDALYRDSLKVITMRSIQYSDHIKALKIGFEILETNNSDKVNHPIAQTYNTLGDIFSDQGYFGLAEEYYASAMTNYLLLDDTLAVGWLYVNMGNLYFKNKFFDDAERNYRKALQLFKDIKLLTGQATVYNNMALIQIELDSFNFAINNYKKALVLRQNNSDSALVAHSYLYIGELYLIQNQNIEAQKYFEKALEIALLKDTLNLVGRSNQLLGEAYAALGNDSLCAHYFNMAEAEFMVSENTNYLIDLYNAEADIYKKNENFLEAKNSLLNSLDIAKEQNSLIQQVSIYEQLLSLIPKWNPPVDSIEITWRNELNKVYSILYKAEVGKSLMMIEMRDELMQYKVKIKLKEAEVSRAKILRNGLIIIGFLSILVFVVLYIRYREVRSKDAIIAEQKELYHAQQMYVEEVKTERVKLRLAAEHRELVMKATFIQQKNELISSFKKELKYQISLLDDDKVKGLRSLLTTMNKTMKAEDILQDFESHFIDVHPEFLEGLSKKYPKLSAKDLKMCAYHKMNLDTKEIARIAGVTVRSVQTSRYRLRIKLNIPKDVSLIAFFNA